MVKRSAGLGLHLSVLVIDVSRGPVHQNRQFAREPPPIGQTTWNAISAPHFLPLPLFGYQRTGTLYFFDIIGQTAAIDTAGTEYHQSGAAGTFADGGACLGLPARASAVQRGRKVQLAVLLTMTLENRPIQAIQGRRCRKI